MWKSRLGSISANANINGGATSRGRESGPKTGQAETSPGTVESEYQEWHQETSFYNDELPSLEDNEPENLSQVAPNW